LYDATTNDDAQCAALYALYAAAGGAGWHLSSDWNASKAGNYGGAHNAALSRIPVRTDGAPPVEGDIFNILIPSGADLEPPGHGYDYYDFWKYDYALEMQKEEASYEYTFDDNGDFTGLAQVITVTPYWPNRALFNLSFDVHAHAATGGWAAAAAGTPTDFCTFYGVFCSFDGNVAIMCVRARACGRARAPRRPAWSARRRSRVPWVQRRRRRARMRAHRAARGCERQRNPNPRSLACARSSADVHAAPCAARRAASCRATTWRARCRLSSSTCRTSFTCAFLRAGIHTAHAPVALTRRLPGRDSNLNNNTLSGAIPALPTSLQYLCAPRAAARTAH
jgi:hypothetical protein